jgi:hypothetical protein
MAKVLIVSPERALLLATESMPRLFSKAAEIIKLDD